MVQQGDIDKRMTLAELRSQQRALIHTLLENINESLVSDFLFFSYIGARICYATSHPLKLFSEERFRNFEAFTNFLVHLKRLEHYSVFAHTPIFVNINNLSISEKIRIAQTYFKVFWDENERVALFNLRHFAENLNEEEFLSLINAPCDIHSIKIIFYKNFVKIFEGDFDTLPSYLIEEKDTDFFAVPEVIIIECKKTHPFRWIGVIVHNFSRIFSHQFVRHTWLNFNQRSHRYTQVDKFILPENFTDYHKNKYKELIETSMELYNEFMRDLRRESARFVTPQGAATSLLATGPKLVWEDFIAKRAIPQAQEEIRKLAFMLKDYLKL